jgi:hypothetical protein
VQNALEMGESLLKKFNVDEISAFGFGPGGTDHAIIHHITL